MKKRIIAVNSNCYHGYSIEEAIAGIRRAGFHYIELTATKGWTEHVFPDMPFERLLAIQDELEAAHPDLNLPELSCGMSEDFEPALEEGSTLVRLGRVVFSPEFAVK